MVSAGSTYDLMYEAELCPETDPFPFVVGMDLHIRKLVGMHAVAATPTINDPRQTFTGRHNLLERRNQFVHRAVHLEFKLFGCLFKADFHFHNTLLKWEKD